MEEVANNQIGDIANKAACHMSKFSGRLLPYVQFSTFFNHLFVIMIPNDYHILDVLGQVEQLKTTSQRGRFGPRHRG